jgi:hypothetical protein
MLFQPKFIRYFHSDDSGGGGDPPSGNGDGDAKKEEDQSPAKDQLETWEKFLETQPDDIKTLYASHTAGLRSALQKERDAAKLTGPQRQRLQELEKLQKDREDAEKTETQKLADQVASLTSQLTEAKDVHNEQLIRLSVIAEAAALLFKNPEDAYLLVDLEGIEVDEDGKIKGISSALKELAKKKPYLLKSSDEKQPPDIDAQTGNQKQPTKPTEEEKERVRRRFRI